MPSGKRQRRDEDGKQLETSRKRSRLDKQIPGSRDVDLQEVCDEVSRVLNRMEKAVRKALKHAQHDNIRALIKKKKKLSKLDSESESLKKVEQEWHSTKAADLTQVTPQVIVAKLAKNKLFPSQSVLKRSLDGSLDGQADEIQAWPIELVASYPLLKVTSCTGQLARFYIAQAGKDPEGKQGPKHEQRALSRLTSAQSVAEETTRYCRKLQKVVQRISPEKLEPVEKPKADGSPGSEESASEDGEDVASSSRIVDEGFSKVDLRRYTGTDKLSEVHMDKIQAEGESSDEQYHTASETGADPSPHSEEEEEEEDDADSLSIGSDTGRGLPALAAGYISRPTRFGDRGSESDWSDDEEALQYESDDAGDAKGKRKERKNRMGQRARKALWEKKYGKGAHHVQRKLKEQRTDEKLQARREKWASGGNAEASAQKQRAWGSDCRNAAANGSARHKSAARPDAGPPAQKATSSGRGRSGAHSTEPPPRSASTTKERENPSIGAMHPSWVAKQKQKQIESLAAQPQGRKIVFD